MKDKVSPRKTRTYNKKKVEKRDNSIKKTAQKLSPIHEPNAGKALFVLKNDKGELLQSEFKDRTFVVSFESKELAKKCRDALNGDWHVSHGPDHRKRRK